ncbi:hypothetical protein O9993_03040 [Vibrio lentus]|nr:hypothetical protein [Vibrio lentus]
MVELLQVSNDDLAFAGIPGVTLLSPSLQDQALQYSATITATSEPYNPLRILTGATITYRENV